MSSPAPSPETAAQDGAPKPAEKGLGGGALAVGLLAAITASGALCCAGNTGLAIFDATSRANDAETPSVPATAGRICNSSQEAVLEKAETARNAMLRDKDVQAAVGSQWGRMRAPASMEVRCATHAETQPRRGPEQLWLDAGLTVYGPDFFTNGSTRGDCHRASLELVAEACQASTKTVCPAVNGKTSLGAPSDLTGPAKTLYAAAFQSCIEANQ